MCRAAIVRCIFVRNIDSAIANAHTVGPVAQPNTQHMPTDRVGFAGLSGRDDPDNSPDNNPRAKAESGQPQCWRQTDSVTERGGANVNLH